MADTHHQTSGRISGLIAQVEVVTPLVTSTVPIPGTNIGLKVTHPASIDALLDDVAADPEENLPYWAEIWPSGIALASEVLRYPEAVYSKPVLELGCGVGITAAAAIMAGAQLVATDYSPHSLMLTALTCVQAGLPEPSLRHVNWRAADADLFQPTGDQWPLVLAADVLYEQRDIAPVLAVLQRIVAPGGTVWLAEPDRRIARAAVEMARASGWRIESRTLPGPWHGANRIDGEVTIHKMAKPGHND